MTITELTQILESLQDLQASQIRRLEEMVGLKEIGTQDMLLSQQQQQQQQPTPEQYSAFAGRPLDAVVETDHETDASRTATPGSLPFFSPDYGLSTGKKDFSLTPETPPTFQDLRLSASTVSILEQETRGSVGSFLHASCDPFVVVETTNAAAAAAAATTARMNRSSGQDADDEASSIDETSSEEDDEDDDDADETFDEGRIIATARTVVAEGRESRFQRQSMQAHVQDHQNDEDDDDDETFDEGRTIATAPTVVAEGRQSRFQRQSIQTHAQDQQGDNSDDESFDEDRTIATAPTVVAEGRQSRFQRQSIQTHAPYQQDDGGDDGETCDDSAMYCPTVAARDRIQPGPSLDDLAQDNHANSPSENPNITHIEVDYGLSSPTPTNLTMDTAAFLNETIGQLDTVFEKEDAMSVASDETPILDRYRIDIDENSPNGFRVVPNERGTRHPPRNTHSSVTPATGSAKKASPEVAASTMPKTPLSNRRSKPVFRKTPYPKKKFPTTPTIDENTPFNGSVSPSVRPVRSVESPLASHRPLRPLASPKLERTRLSYPISHQEERPTPTSTLPPSLIYAKAVLEMENPGSSSRLESTRTFQPLPGRSDLNAVVGHHIRPVTLTEYDNGPRVVKMQVSFDVLNDATAALNDSLCQRLGARAKQLEHSEANQILQPLGISERKSRSILMTLCHFRRLMMKRHSVSGDKNHDIVFDVVTA
jgi:hypothetical protein